MNPVTLKLTIVRDDSIPAFAGFCRTDNPQAVQGHILLNVEAAMTGGELADGTPVENSSAETKYVIISSLMHEFGHALEQFFNLPVNEQAIEAACQTWKYKDSQP